MVYRMIRDESIDDDVKRDAVAERVCPTGFLFVRLTFVYTMTAGAAINQIHASCYRTIASATLP